jgi:GT2 family glycosyltransferase
MALALDSVGIAIVVLTYNRVHLLEQCVERVLRRTSAETAEILIWNNGSSDGTRAYLDALVEPRIRVVHHERNIGPNAYDVAFRRTTAPYLVELDDDIIEAPNNWDATLLEAFRKLPETGLLSANLAKNPNDRTAAIMYGENASLYKIVEVDGLRLKVGGPIGGGCAITSREIFERVGGFGRNRRQVYWDSDASLMRKLQAAGLQGAYLDDLEVVHAGGPYYSEVPAAKREFWVDYHQRARRRERVKNVLLRLPYVRTLNERHGWFVAP